MIFRKQPCPFDLTRLIKRRVGFPYTLPLPSVSADHANLPCRGRSVLTVACLVPFAALSAFGVCPAPLPKMAHLQALEALRWEFLESLYPMEAPIQKEASLFHQEISDRWFCKGDNYCTGLPRVRW